MIDRKNAILITVVLTALAIGGLYIPFIQSAGFRQVGPALTTMGTTTDVYYTNRGFKPPEITVPVGTYVQWINASDKPMWVASNPHPSHTDLQGFDERGVEGNVTVSPQSFVPTAYAHIVQGAYQYRFLKIGRFAYHNHLVPNDGGIVIVTSTSSVQ